MEENPKQGHANGYAAGNRVQKNLNFLGVYNEEQMLNFDDRLLPGRSPSASVLKEFHYQKHTAEERQILMCSFKWL